MIEERDFELDEFDQEDESWEELETDEKTAFIVAIVRQNEASADVEASLDELERLADTAGIMVLGRYTQKRNQPERSTYFGRGWLNEIAEKMHQAQAELLIVNEELSPIQGRNIEKQFSITVIDRTEVILSIFHDHARTREARLQVKLAELEYQLPRLRKLWGHFDKERGSMRAKGGAASRGMGEKQIEIDKRLIRQQIRRVTHWIETVTHQKETQRKGRDKTLKLCLVGYTNAGKSTLFNALTGAGVLVEDKLFATLDSTSRQLKLSTGQPLVISDTVGFISRLPHHLVASFRATLMEVRDADLLLHMVDVSDERFEYYIEQVNLVLNEIGADQLPQILVLNKIDLLDATYLTLLKRRFPWAVFISASQQDRIPDLLSRVEQALLDTRQLTLHLPFDQGGLASRLHEIADIHTEEYREDGIWLQLSLSGRDLRLVEKYIVE
ncbi:MAG TPA: GTPase HflX [Candidatus Cloacimonadota bacterium]|nr:GTPase HflX [Candidatus Cloacimonadota bacterium]HOH79615.1 GTPase HflX [Candidatus Cloacimonadota bacterium]